MIEQAQVILVSPDKKSAVIVPIITGHCISCKEACARRGNPFEASNPKLLDIKEGSIVIIDSSKKAEAIQSFFSIAVPTGCAITAYNISGAIADWINVSLTEGFKAACVVAAIGLSCAAIYAVTRFIIKPVKPHITEIC